MTEDTSPENLRKFLESDDPALVRMGLSMAKGSQKPKDYHHTLVQTLQRLLESHEPATRRIGLAVVAASDIPEKLYKNVFGLSLWDPEEENRETAEEMVKKIGLENITEFPGWLEPFDQEDVDFWVRVGAVQTLREIGDERAVEPLINSLKDERAGVRESAARALGKIGDSRAVEPLIKALAARRGQDILRDFKPLEYALKMFGVQGLQGFITAGKGEGLTISELKMILKEKKLPTSGTKALLIQRIMDAK